LNPFQSIIATSPATPLPPAGVPDATQLRWHLQTLLPWPQAGEAGSIVLACSKKDGTWPHHSVRTHQEAERLLAALQSDSRVEGIFAAQARMAGPRKAANALAFCSVWLDLDGQDFQCDGDDDEAVMARIRAELQTFVVTVGLPAPSVIVASGGGAHCYWLFSSQLPKDRWEPIARALAECVNATGLAADVGCTTDAARLMRIAGTTNRKPKYITPRPVEVISPENGRPVSHDPASIEDILTKFAANTPAAGLAQFTAKPPPAPLRLAVLNELGAGIDRGSWFSRLPGKVTSSVLDYALQTVATQTKYLELERHGGDNRHYYRIMQACARSGAPDAEDLWVKYASSAEEADADDKLRADFRRCAQASNRFDGVTIGTLLHLAKEHGADFTTWKGLEPPAKSLLPGRTAILKGGSYAAADALTLLNTRYLVGETDDEVAIFRIRPNGTLAYTPKEQFQLDLADITVEITNGHGRVTRLPASKFWLQNPNRHRRIIVFKPSGSVGQDEYNLWRGFALVPQPGRQKLRRFLRHIREILCRRDRRKFKYVLRWLAFAVQHPDKHPGTVLVLKSRMEGTGKSTVGWVMRQIFGEHALLVDDQERLLGRFTEHLETVCFVQAEELMWAGDGKTADKLKSRITAETIPVEAKFRKAREVANRMHVIMTTNHEHAIAAGMRDRRYVVLDVAEDVAQSKAWFDPLYADLENGGTGQLLDFLLNIKLGAWHPRDIIKTAETGEQQRLSADSIWQWMQACINADAIIGSRKGTSYDMSKCTAFEDLREAYAGYCAQHRLRALSQDALGKRLTAMFGPRARMSAGSRRPWGYNVTDGNTWQTKLDDQLGVT
jgi:Family of unknown function (DUF5906)